MPVKSSAHDVLADHGALGAVHRRRDLRLRRRRLLRPIAQEVTGHRADRAGHRDQPDRLEQLLGHPHRRGNLRIGGQPVPLGAVAVREHGHHGGAADAGRIVEQCVRMARGLERRDALLAHRDHVFLGAELQAPGRARFHARRLDADADAVDAQRALGHLAGLLVEPRHVEWTPGRA
jgi:hypothetical protein